MLSAVLAKNFEVRSLDAPRFLHRSFLLRGVKLVDRVLANICDFLQSESPCLGGGEFSKARPILMTLQSDASQHECRSTKLPSDCQDISGLSVKRFVSLMLSPDTSSP